MTEASAPAQDPVRVDVAVAGGGAAGLAAAIALSRQGWDVAVIGPTAPRRDGRTIALMDGSVRILQQIGVWPALEPLASPLVTLTIIDDTGALFRAPPTSFQAGELGLDAFGQNIEAAPLTAALAEAADQRPGLSRIDDSAASLRTNPDKVVLSLKSGRRVEAALVVGADGRHSLVREAAGIRAREWSYTQTAVTAILAHERPHHDTSTEFHTREGPFTLVPMQGRRSSLVWLLAPEKAERVAALDDAAFAAAVEKQAQSILGAMRLDGPRGAVPMGGVTVDRFAGERSALVGEAAHVFPPIGAQGLNLGLRDVAALAKAVGPVGGDPGAPDRLAAYDRARRIDVRSRTAAVDLLNRSLLSGFLPVDIARGLGLMALSSIGPLRRFAMRQGLGTAP
ncbi:ubiquinone biosynthesis protein UbiH [Alsobacter soli]|uniref:Ubiquinone biosynthesis protein UbiH n=1 Tax=Alsobacter soli TaxID=2109933 RepID=A0A2T1HQ63_9HYPH|nr:UbiH/UbiF family hydroxylase [Alsobacter soli]PSC03659.1 ubiquinone biosynthesis protein UbiH [Alsobacter soli]